MYSLLISLLIITANPLISQDDEAPPPDDLEVIIHELDQTLDHFFLLLDDQSLDTFIAGVKHASRARLLLEQFLGEEIDDLGHLSAPSEQEKLLRLIAKRAQDLSGDAGRELWRQDFDDKQWALLRLSELENMVKWLKKTTSS